VERLSGKTQAEPARILVFVPNWVGDAVMATPALGALRRRFPAARIVVVARPYVREVLEGLACVDGVRGLESLTNRASLGSFFRDARVLCAEGFDLAVLMTNSFRSALFARLAGIKARLGYARDARDFLLTIRVSPQREDGSFRPSPMIDYYLKLVAALGADSIDRAMRLAVTPNESAAAEAVLSELGVDRTKPLAVINPGAAFGSAKCWPPESFAAVADALAAKGYEVVVETSPRERETGEAIGAAAKTALKPVWRAEISLGALKGLIAGAAVLVTNDSGPRHIGAALGVPVVTIMGPTDPRWSHTGYEREVILRKDVDCAPCMLRECPTDHKCMTLITPEEVVIAVDEVRHAARAEEVSSR
jgi:heptosyltransferase-2